MEMITVKHPDGASDDYWAICPWCDAHMGDTWEWVQGERKQREKCQECGKDFMVRAEYTVTYHTELPAEADGLPIKGRHALGCLNDFCEGCVRPTTPTEEPTKEK